MENPESVQDVTTNKTAVNDGKSNEASIEPKATSEVKGKHFTNSINFCYWV